MGKVKITSPLLVFPLILAFLTLSFVILFQKKLPPEVPLFYGAAEGESQLVSSWALVVPAISSIVLVLVNSFLSSILKDDFVKKVLIFSALIVTLFSVITTLKIAFLVGSF